MKIEDAAKILSVVIKLKTQLEDAKSTLKIFAEKGNWHPASPVSEHTFQWCGDKPWEIAKRCIDEIDKDKVIE